MLKMITKKLSKFSILVVFFLFLRLVFNTIDDFLRKLFGKKPILYYLEFHVTDNCNLNCNSCMHFCNLVKQDVFMDIESYKKDLNRLVELFDNIRTITLLGGEPLLHNELPRIIYEARQAFPHSKIHLLTNGLLYKKLSTELVETIKENNVLVRVSLYKPMIKHEEEMRQEFSSLGMRFLISKPVAKFSKYLNLAGDSDVRKVILQCSRAKCTLLIDGFISRCGLPSLIKYFNYHFDASIEMESSLTDIHASELDGFTLKKKLFKPLDACRYCTKRDFIDWSVGHDPKKEDYCVM